MIALLQVVVAILIAGVLVWAIDSLPGIDATFKSVAKVLIIAVLVIWVILLLYGLVVGGVPLRLWR